jgi:Ca-activated chloride channel family protein
MIGIGSIAGVLLAGWLADKLASTDADVEAGIDAYEAGDHDGALGHYDRAVERLGERAEISFDRGLALLAKGEVEPARTAFERASEADDTEVRASALYELGNLALDAEDFDGAIAKYIDCLKARPDHENAKWNLELALLRKQKKDEEEEEKKDEDQGSDSGGESGDESGGESGGSEEGGSGSGGSEEGGESGDDEKQDDQKQDEKQDDQKQDESKQDQKQDDQKQDDQKQDESKQDQKQDESKQAPPEPTPAERFDLQRALDQLDEQDQYPLDRARVRTAPARKDW